jgi:hypothetical protein
MEVIGGVRIEVSARSLDGHFPQELRGGELVERVINRCKLDARASRHCFEMKLLRSDMPVLPAEQKLGQEQPLTCGPQARLPQFEHRRAGARWIFCRLEHGP